METFDLLVSYFVLYYHCQSPEVSSSDSLLYFCLANKPVEKNGRKLARALAGLMERIPKENPVGSTGLS